MQCSVYMTVSTASVDVQLLVIGHRDMYARTQSMQIEASILCMHAYSYLQVSINIVTGFAVAHTAFHVLVDIHLQLMQLLIQPTRGMLANEC